MQNMNGQTTMRGPTDEPMAGGPFTSRGPTDEPMAGGPIPEVVGQETAGRSLKQMGTDLMNNLKGPVFWVAVGFVIAKWMDRKKKHVA